MNQARTNLTYPPPPVNFMTLDVFRHLNKFEAETLDPRWSACLKHELEKDSDIKRLLPDLPHDINPEVEPRLWTYIKDERNEEEI